MALEDEFRKAKSPRIVYKGQEIFLHHQVPVVDGRRLRVIVESYDSNWGNLGQSEFREGVGLMIDKTIRVDDVSCQYLVLWPHDPPREQLQPPYFELQEIETGYYIKVPRDTISLWLHRPFEHAEFTCTTKDGHLHVWNVWNDGNVRHGIDRRLNGAGMIVEKIEKGFRYRCNDGYPDEDFDDIVFRIELM